MMDSTRSTDFPTLFLFCFVSSEKVGFGHNTTMASTTAYMPATETMTTGQSPVDTSTTADMPAAKTMTAVHSEAPPDFVVSIPPVSVKPIKKVKYKYITRRQANALVIDSGEAVAKALHGLEPARRLAEQAGLTVDSSILGNETSAVDSHLNVVLMTTGGFSNRDHLVEITGDPRTDRISELKRNLQRRARSMKPEDRAENKWDKPRLPGERRRRIIREQDRPDAPPDPPPSGYVVFVCQMTAKIRHDRPSVQHNQSKVMKEISKIWRIGMNDSDRRYYNDFAVDARQEYLKQQIEYRATGGYTPSSDFTKLDGVNVWVRAAWHEKSGLEREIVGYDSVIFPRRPPEFNEEYERRNKESILRRKLKVKDLLNDDGTLREGAAEYLEKEGASEYVKVFQKKGGSPSFPEGDDDDKEDDEVLMQEESPDEEQLDE